MSKRIAIAVTFIVALAAVALCGVCCASKSDLKKASPRLPAKATKLPAKATKLPLNLISQMEMISIPAGSFDMGTPDNYTGDHNVNQHPQHSVTLSAYTIGKYEVTRGQHIEFMEAGGYGKKAYWSTAGWSWKGTRSKPDSWIVTQAWKEGQIFTQTDNHPIVGVTYYEAEAFCNWAGGHLPTEAQWERAARWTGTHANVYPWGDVWDAEKCNNLDDHNSAGGGYQYWQTSPVGSYPSGASPSGCQDMAGNVFEWCKDWYVSAYYSQSPANDPQGPAFESGSRGILRGGSWYTVASYFRCATRFFCYPDHYNYDLGFRLAR